MNKIKIALIILLVVVSVTYMNINARSWFLGAEEGPTLQCPEDMLEVSVLEDESALLHGVTAYDRQDGDLTDKVKVASVSKLISEDTAKVSYLVFDSDDNMASAERYIRYLDYSKPKIRVDKPLRFNSVSNTNFLDCISARDDVDGDITRFVRVSTLSTTLESDVYKVMVMVTNSLGDTSRVDLPVIIVDGTADLPEIILEDYLVYLNQGSDFDPEDYLVSVTGSQRNYSVSDVEIQSDVNTEVTGTYWVTYTYVHQNRISKTILTVVVR